MPPLFRGGGNGDDGSPQVGGQRIPGGDHGLQVGVRRCGWLQASDGLLQRQCSAAGGACDASGCCIIVCGDVVAGFDSRRLHSKAVLRAS